MPVVHGSVPVPALNDGAALSPVPGALALVAIGVVHSPCRDRHAMPGEGVAATIEVYAEHAGELDGIEDTSHLAVLGWLHEAHTALEGEGRRQTLPDLPARGAFATRSPRRPNPISLSVVRLVARHGNALEVEGLDLIDGTIVVDLKPYLPGLDSVFDAVREWRSRTNRGRERLAGYLEQETRNHLGSVADDTRGPPRHRRGPARCRAPGRGSAEPGPVGDREPRGRDGGCADGPPRGDARERPRGDHADARPAPGAVRAWRPVDRGPPRGAPHRGRSGDDQPRRMGGGRWLTQDLMRWRRGVAPDGDGGQEPVPPRGRASSVPRSLASR